MKILCIDDSPDILEIQGLSLKIRWPDAEVLKAKDGRMGLALLDSDDPDLIILDLGLPDMDGYEVIRRIRLCSEIPIVIVSVRDGEHDIVKGLDLGADDFITKPFGHLEFLARIQAVLRRASVIANGHDEATELGKLRMVPSTREVFMDGDLVSLTPTEYSILYHLARNSDRIVTYQALLSKVWGGEAVDDRHLLTVHMKNLRSKLGDTGQEPNMILTERGIGYRIAKN